VILLISTPVIAAAIGYFTNMLAVKMIFRPFAPVRILGFEFQGLIPKRRGEIARRIGQTVSEELVSVKDVTGFLKKIDFRREIDEIVDRAVEDKLQNLQGASELLYRLVPSGVVSALKEMLSEEVHKGTVEFMDRCCSEMEHKLDLRDIVVKKIEAFDLQHLEEIILNIAARELRAIEILGGVLGFIVGILQVAMMLASRVLF
jgi:uncharacterized membrane protein YheB (UPF0754 family)